MRKAGKRPCSICRQWFLPEPRVRERQQAGIAEAENPSQLTSPESRVRPHQTNRTTRGAPQRTVAIARAVEPTTLGRRERPVRAWARLIPEQTIMQLEFHQLDRRWEHLLARQPLRQRRLMASLAGCGQQTPIIVVVSAETASESASERPSPFGHRRAVGHRLLALTVKSGRIRLPSAKS
jgi:hypothetical protein